MPKDVTISNVVDKTILAGFGLLAFLFCATVGLKGAVFLYEATPDPFLQVVGGVCAVIVAGFTVMGLYDPKKD